MSRTRNVGGMIIKTTGGDHKIYSEGNILQNAGNTIIETGKEKGVSYGKPESPVLNVNESKYKFESTYAHDQLCSLADDLGEISFMIFMLQIFGHEIEISALSKLYRDLSDRKITNPEILVSRTPVQGYNAGYSNKRKKIIVYEKFIDEAATDNDKSAELLAALVEEYGHHIDNLLRTELATNGIPDTDIIDEGAKFAYQLFKFDIFKEASLKYAKAETPSFTGDLIVDFSKLHTEITKYVDEDNQYDEVPGQDIPNYGAGRNRKKDKNAAYAHGDIEFEALGAKGRRVFEDFQIRNIYYGNWLRDFSQIIVGFTVRSTNVAIELQKYKAIQELSPMKFSHEGWVSLMEILAIKEFVYDPLQDAKKEPLDNYFALKKAFDGQFGGLTKDILGLYRPEEHIDNPKGLKDESKLKDDKEKVISFKYKGKDKTLYAGDNGKSWKNDETRNMSNFFWVDYLPERPSTVTYLKEQLILACKHGQTPTGFRHLGAALHVLEDFFSHTNFVEISLRSFGADVYPWIQDYKGKNYKQLPVVSGTFLLDDTFASAVPKIGDLLFDPKLKDYKQRKPKERSLGEMFIYKALADLANGQKSDTAKTNKSYMGVEYSTWLSWFDTYLKFQDAIAKIYEDADKKKWSIKNGPEKIGVNVLQTYQKAMNFTAQIMGIMPKVVFNILLGSFDEVIPELQSHLNPNYGNCPSHSQIAKDSFTHPLNKLSAELAKEAVFTVGKKFKEGMSGHELSEFVALTYFVHPSSKNAEWSHKKIKDWKKDSSNSKALESLKYATIYEHAHHEAKTISDAGVKKIKEIMKFFKEQTK